MFKKSAFTLVELIVVVTILAILATIGFVSYSGYLTGVRDTNRIASLTSISDGLELYRTKNDLPNPDDGINIQIEGTTIANQGYVGANVLQTIEYSKVGKDPKDDSYYSYYLTGDKKYYQLMAFLEEAENLESHSIVGKANAVVNYSNRYPKTYGKRLGIITNLENIPIQETVTTALNFTGGTNTKFKAIFSDSYQYTGSGKVFSELGTIANNISIKKPKDCYELLSPKTIGRNGVYTVYPDGEKMEVYCDMSTLLGGWTLFYANNGNPDSPIKESFVSMRSNVVDNKTGSYDLLNYDNQYLAGLIDYTRFTGDRKRTLLAIHADRGENLGQWVQVSFNNSSSFHFALGSEILGLGFTGTSCTLIPNGGNFSMYSSSGDIFENNNSISHPWGQSISISYDSAPCNGYAGDIARFLLFNSANAAGDDQRTRYGSYIGATWLADNKYRYFIR